MTQAIIHKTRADFIVYHLISASGIWRKI